MKQMNKLTVIIPIHQMDEDTYENFLSKCLDSIAIQSYTDYNILFVVSKEAEAFVREKTNDLQCSIIVKDGDTKYTSMVNYAVDSVETKYFTVIEFDDELNHKWFNNFETYHTAYPDISIFLPIVTHVDGSNNYITLQNEVAWSLQSIVEQDGSFEVESKKEADLGFITVSDIKKKMKYSLEGSIYNTEDFINAGGFKESFKLHYDYEFLLRFLHQGNSAMVIPRTGVKHTNLRENSFSQITSNLNLDEKKFWYSLARKEYMFPKDRNIIYNG